jgi:uncharacterized Ntn-hydrolase superfamily protein
LTFSLIGRCERTGMLGAVVSSSSPAVAARCIWGRAGAGTAATQNVTDPRLGPKMVDAMAGGWTAADAVASVLGEDAIEWRQIAALGTTGPGFAVSGERTLGRHGHVVGDACVAAGNLLAEDGVPAAMADAFQATLGDHLGTRLMAALRAGLEAGGEEGDVRSAGLLVFDRVEWPVVDLRVDWGDDPIARLADLWAVWEPQIDDYVIRALEPASAPGFGVPGE